MNESTSTSRQQAGRSYSGSKLRAVHGGRSYSGSRLGYGTYAIFPLALVLAKPPLHLAETQFAERGAAVGGAVRQFAVEKAGQQRFGFG